MDEMSRDWTQLLWREQTWSERIQNVIAWTAATITSFIMFGFILYILEESLDGISRYNSEHRRCLQNATNGLEIERCH